MNDDSKSAQLRDFAEIVFAALGVYALIGMVFPFENMVMAAITDFGDAEVERLTIRFASVDLVARGTVGFGLIFGRKRLAFRFGSENELPAINPQDLLGVFLATIGAYLSVRAFSNTAQRLVTDPSGQTAIAGVLALALGLWLFFGSRGIANIWHRARTAR